MSAAEKHLLVAVRDRLRTECSYAPEQCEIEFDEEWPAIVGDRYVAVLPAGWGPGPRNSTSGGVSDRVYSVDVAVVLRIRHVPRDRRRDVFLNNVANLDDELERIHNAIDWQYAVNTTANALILADSASAEGFIEPLRFAGVTRKPRLVGPDAFASKETQAAGLARTISFGGARRITTVSR